MEIEQLQERMNNCASTLATEMITAMSNVQSYNVALDNCEALFPIFREMVEDFFDERKKR